MTNLLPNKKSVYFHNGYYDPDREPNQQDAKLAGLPEYPWGTECAPDEVIEMSGNVWYIETARYAPDGWNMENGKVQISFDMQNTGARSRARFRLQAEEG